MTMVCYLMRHASGMTCLKHDCYCSGDSNACVLNMQIWESQEGAAQRYEKNESTPTRTFGRPQIDTNVA